jgi:ATP-dependent protease ClpP protease subunit
VELGDGQMNVIERSMRRLSNLVQQPHAGGWYKVVRNDADGPTRIDIYDEIGGHWLLGGGVTAADFVAELGAITGDVEIHLNSPGGDVWDGLAIFNALAGRPGNVVTVVDGLAASAASVIAQAGKTRIIAPGAMMMIHDASSACAGNAADMRELADLLDKVSDNLAGIYADRTGRADGWRDAMRAETWYTADEAVAAGLAHRLAERPEDQALAAVARFNLSGFRMPDRIAVRLTAASKPSPQHGPFTGTHRHAHHAFGGQGDDQTHEHEHTHDGDADHDHTHPTAHAHTPMQAGPYEPEPYKRGDDETVECPACHKGNAPDARYCDQCGTKLVGREDVTEDEQAAKKAAAKTSRILGVETMPILDHAMAIHHTATVDEPWDGPAAVAAMPNDDEVLRYCHAWVSDEAWDMDHKSGDDDADDKKVNYKFPHHKTNGGPANLNACRNGLARLENSKIPESDKAGVRAHLQAHLDDAKPDHEEDGNGGSKNTLPHWLNDDTAPPPAWLIPAKEATQ